MAEVIWQAQMVERGPQTSYIVFADWLGPRVVPGFVRIATSPGFRHAFVIQQVENGAVIINPLGHGLFVDWTAFDAEDCACACVRAGFSVIKYIHDMPMRFIWRGMMTCTSAVKQVVGMREPFILTPKQLFRECIRRGAEVIEDGESVQVGANGQTTSVSKPAV